MKIKQLFAGIGACVVAMGLGGSAVANTPGQLSADCIQAAARFGIRPNVTFGFAPQYVRDWWVAKNCSANVSDSTTCTRISNDYGTSANVTWGYAPQNVRDWWTAHSCNTTSSRSPCQAASDRYGIAAGVSWGMAPQFVKDYWIANSCNTTYGGFGVTQCNIASFYYRIYANDTFGWAPADASSTDADIQQWWVDNACTTSP